MLKNEVQMSNQVSDTMTEANISSDLLVNNLVYRVGSSLSLMTERASTRLFPQTQQVPNANLSTSIWDFNSGVNFGNHDNSYLVFDVQLVSSDNTSTAYFGSGSAMNLIRNVTGKSRSGTELFRADNANIYSRNYHVNTLSNQFLRRQGLIEGWDTSESGNSGTVRVNALTPSRFVLPLARLAPFFKSYKKGQQLPPQLMAGLHLEIVWEDFRTAFVGITAGAAITNYNITNLSILSDTSMCTDDVQRSINSEAASNGLEIVASQYYVSQMNMLSGETDLNMQIRKAVSQGECVNIVILNTANILNIAADSFAGFAGDATRVQFRLGNLYFPVQPIVSPELQQQENYFMTLQCYGKNEKQFEECGVSYDTYRNGPYYTLNATLEKSAQLQLAGLSINNSRSLETLITFANNNRARTCYAFLDYVSVIKTFIDNVSVAI